MSDNAFEHYVPQLKEGFLWEPIPDGCLLFEETSGKLISLNAAAEAVLTYCDGAFTVAEIRRKLEEDFQIPVTDTDSVVQRLLAEGVLVTATS